MHFFNLVIQVKQKNGHLIQSSRQCILILLAPDLLDENMESLASRKTTSIIVSGEKQMALATFKTYEKLKAQNQIALSRYQIVNISNNIIGKIFVTYIFIAHIFALINCWEGCFQLK